MPPKKKENMTFSEIAEMIQAANDQLQMKEEVVHDFLLSKDINLEKLTELYQKYPDDSFSSVTDESEISIAFNTIAGEKTESCLSDYEKKEKASRYELMKRLVVDALKEQKDLEADRKTIKDLQDEFSDLVKEQAEYMASEKYDKDLDSFVEDITDRIVKLRKSMIGDIGKDYSKQKEVERFQREAMVIEQRYTLEYMYDRLDSPETKDTEPERLMNIFFSKKQAIYLMNRYSSKCTQLGVESQIFQRVLNIEEKFLEPEFHVYNNFYLFFVVNYMAYADVQRPREAKSAMRNLVCLVDNRFSTNAARETFLDTIRKFLQRFADYRDVFSERNITHPGHPYRIEKDAQRTEALRVRILADLTKLKPGIENDTELNVSTMSVNELIDLRNNVAKEIVDGDTPQKISTASTTAFVVDSLPEFQDEVTTTTFTASEDVTEHEFQQAPDNSVGITLGRGNTTPIIHQAINDPDWSEQTEE